MSEVAITASATSGPTFDDYVVARGASLWQTAWLLTGDHHRAEDLVQTALGKSWPHWDRVAAQGSFDAYVRKTMLTTYIAWWHRRWNGEYATPQLPETSEDDDQTRVAQRYDLMTALAALPRGQRAVVVLRYFEDLTETQVAAVLDCSVGTVKSQNARAMKALRECRALAPEEEDNEA